MLGEIDLKKVKKIAVVGATPNKEKYGNKIIHDLKNKGFEIYPVNPKYSEIEGLKCYKNITSVPKDVDLVVFVVPPNVGIKVLEEAINAGFKNFWFQPGAESGEIIKEIVEKNVNAVVGACIMVETSKL